MREEGDCKQMVQEHSISKLCNDPLSTPLDILVQQQRHIPKNKSTDVEPKELRSMASAEFETNMC